MSHLYPREREKRSKILSFKRVEQLVECRVKLFPGNRGNWDSMKQRNMCKPYDFIMRVSNIFYRTTKFRHMLYSLYIVRYTYICNIYNVLMDANE